MVIAQSKRALLSLDFVDLTLLTEVIQVGVV